MRVFEHFEACHTPWGGGALTRSTRRVAHPMPFRFDRYNEPRDSQYSDARPDHGYSTTDACESPQCGCFDHFEACSAPWGGGAVTRSMRRVAHPMPLRFDRYNESRDSQHSDARSDRGYLTTDACEWPQCGCFGTTLRLAPHHGAVGHSPDRCGGSRTRRRYGLTVTTSPGTRNTVTPDPIADI